MVNQDEQGTLVKNTSWVPIFVTRRDVFLKLKKHKVGSIYLSEMKAEEFVIYWSPAILRLSLWKQARHDLRAFQLIHFISSANPIQNSSGPEISWKWNLNMWILQFLSRY